MIRLCTKSLEVDIRRGMPTNIIGLLVPTRSAWFGFLYRKHRSMWDRYRLVSEVTSFQAVGILGGRDLAISDESEHSLEIAFSKRGHDHHVSAFSLGDVSFHHGWTYHRAGLNHIYSARKAMTIIYMEDGIRLTPSIRSEHEVDREAFIPGRKPGERADTFMNPLLNPYYGVSCGHMDGFRISSP